MFASAFVGAGSWATGAAPLAPHPGASGASGFLEQLKRATAQSDDSGSTSETPSAGAVLVNRGSESVPAKVPASLPSAPPKSVTPGRNADSNDDVSSSDADNPGAADKLTQPVVIARGTRLTAAGSPPPIAGGRQRRELSDDDSAAVSQPLRTGSGLPSNQNADVRDVIPAQNSISGSPSVLADLILPAEIADSVAPAAGANAGFSCMDRTLAFGVRIKPDVSVSSSQGRPAPGVKTSADGDTGLQTEKSPRAAFPKDGDSGHDEPDNPSASSSTSSSSATKPSLRKDEADSAANAIESTTGPAIQLISQSVSVNIPASSQPGLQVSAKPAEQSPTLPEPVLTPLETPNQTNVPARNISLQVEGASGQMVDVSMAARSGDLSVAVRSGDAAVAQDLRQGLGDLESRLAQSGYHAETWHPGHNGSSTEPTSSGSNSSNSSSQQQSQSGSGWSQQNRGQRDNNPSNRPRWANQLASTLKAESAEKGHSNGIGT